MWDFDLGRAFGAIVKTAPFIVFRLLVYVGIGFAYLIATGVGAGIGYGLTYWADEPGAGAGIGGFIGFAVVAGILYWAREYILYLVKAGHIAVLVEYYDGKALPEGRGQIDHAQAVVKERFKETSVLFAVDQLIKGVLRAVNRMLMGVANAIPIPNLDSLMKFIGKIIDMSLTYVDEIILARAMRIRSDNAWESAKDGVILYAQNYKTMLKNAVFLMLFMYLVAFLIFLVILAPVGALVAILPGKAGGFMVFLLAVIFAWSLKAAILEPLAIAALMEVYFKAIEGQTPNPEWDAKLTAASKKFKEMKDKALAAMKAPPASASAPPDASAPS